MSRVDFRESTLIILHTSHERHGLGEHCMRTFFSDGTFAGACPNYDDESMARALSLGYGDDIWLMTLEHEILHTLTAEYRGEPYSIILWNVAHGGGNKWPAGGKEEEARTLAFAAWVHQDRFDPVLNEYAEKRREMLAKFLTISFSCSLQDI